MHQILVVFGLILCIFTPVSRSLLCCQPSPTDHSLGIQRRTDPFFPDSPPSCPICAKSYPSINSCAKAAPILANFTQIIFNPGAFIDVIKCACADTFQAAFPQCVDCFVQTNQTDVLQTPNLPSVLDGMRKVCALESTLMGGVATADGEATPTSSSGPTSSASMRNQIYSAHNIAVIFVFAIMGMAI